MNILSIIAHIGLLIHCGKDIEAIVQNLVQKKESWPSKEEYLELLQDAIDLLSSGLLNLPSDIVKTMTDALNQVKSQLTPPQGA